MTNHRTARITDRLWLALVPELSRIDQRQRPQALTEAGHSELQKGEMIVLGLWLAISFFLTQSLWISAPADSRILAATIASLFVGLPLLLLVVVPIQIRRLRRGIRRQLEKSATARPVATHSRPVA